MIQWMQISKGTLVRAKAPKDLINSRFWVVLTHHITLQKVPKVWMMIGFYEKPIL